MIAAEQLGLHILKDAHHPMLVVFDVKPDQIHAASRTRLSSAILDAMVLGSLSGTDESSTVTQ